MRLPLLILLLCSAILVSCGVVDRSLSPNVFNKWPALSGSDKPTFNISLYRSILHHIGQAKCTVPAALMLNRTGYLTDGTFGCVIADSDPPQAQRDCQAACSPTSPKIDVLDDVGPSVICWALQYPDGDCKGELIRDQDRVLGRCLCDVPVLDYAINWFATEALPKIDAAVCEVFWGIARLLVNIGISAIPAEGQGLKDAWALLAGVTGFTNKVGLTDIEIGNDFLSWLDPCPHVDGDLGDQIIGFFDELADLAAGFGLPVGPRRPQRPPPKSIGPPSMSALPGSSASAMPPASQPPTSLSTPPAASPPSRPTETTPTSTPPPSSADSSSSPSSTQNPDSSTKACRFAKRDASRQNTEVDWWYCDGNGVTHMTRITSIVFGEQKSTVPRQCSAKWSHACAHYASVLSVSAARGWDLITCSDFLGTHQTSRKRPAITQWNKDHHSAWVDPKWRREEGCDRDEYPPVYFFQDNNDVLANTRQLVRLIPEGMNRGAGIGLWGPFCWSEGLKDPHGRIVLPGGPDTKLTDPHKGYVTWMTYVAMAVSHRPVFTISDWDNFGGLNMQDWGLAENPCIPDGLVNDKYFPLLGGDPTLTAGPGSWSYDYKILPPDSVLATASTYTH